MLKLPDVLKHRKNLMCRKSILRRCGTSSRQMLPRPGRNRILHMSAIVRQGDAGSRLVRMVDMR